jgi:signal transduction histidine kinase/CheY-like chemotaxis protein
MPIDQISEDVIQAEHVRTTFRQFPVVILVHISDAAVVAGLLAFFTDTPPKPLAYWFAAVLAVAFMRLVAFRRYRDSETQVTAWRRWSTVAAAFSGAFGILWATAIVLFLNMDVPFSVILLVVVPIGMTAGSAATSAAVPKVFFSFLFTVVPTLVFVLVGTGTPLGYAIGAMSFATLLADISICLTIHKALDQSLRLRLENEMLRDEAERANRAKTRFLAAASHDLRQPIHALGLFFSALAERIRGREADSLIGRIEETIGVVTNMLNALLDISKLDAGVVEPKVGPTGIDKLFQRLETELSAAAREQGNRLRFRPCRAWVRTDPAMLERILRNLIGNALRYTDGGRVLVAGRRRGAELRVEVWDTGCGIPRERIDEIFVEFQQLGNPQRDRTQGLGLGLAIVRRLARLLGHRLDVRSTPGRGSCFAISLPLLPEQDRERFREAPAPEQALAGDTERLLVLVLDDDSIVREAMAELLRDWGYEVLLAATLDEALAVAAGRLPDLLVVDYRLPGDVTGGDAIQALHARAERSIPALVITGDTAPDRLREATARGYPFLHKPVQPAKLRSTLRYLAQHRDAMSQSGGV